MIKSFEEREEDAIAAFRQKMEAAFAVYQGQRHRAVFKGITAAAAVLVIEIIAFRLWGYVPSLTLCALLGAGAWGTTVAAARDTLVERISGGNDPLLIGVIAEMIRHRQKEVRQAAEQSVRRLLPKTRAEQGRTLTPKAIEGLQALLHNGYTKDQAVAALNLVSQRHEQRAREIAESLIRFPASCFPHRLKPEEAAEVKETALRTLESIDANRERLRLQETLLRPTDEAVGLPLLRPAAGTGVPEEQLLRPGCAGEE
jgi:hypothetical protein